MKSNSKLVAKKRGRPVGSTNKAKNVIVKKSFKRVADADKLFENILTNELIMEQEAKILNLEHQVIGYKAVISYLEHQLRESK
jgi:hypothetical protein